jgi:hypothetical protein
MRQRLWWVLVALLTVPSGGCAWIDHWLNRPSPSPTAAAIATATATRTRPRPHPPGRTRTPTPRGTVDASTHPAEPATAVPQEPTATSISLKPSKMDRVKYGMSASDVIGIMGEPDTKKDQCTWRCGWPGYSPEEAQDTVFCYMQQGTITFRGSGSLLQNQTARVRNSRQSDIQVCGPP